MTTALGTDAIAIAAELLAEFGVAATLVVPTAAYDTATDTRVGGGPASYACVIVAPYAQSARLFQFAVGLTDLTTVGRLETIMQAKGLAVAPLPGHTLSYNGKTYLIQAVDVIAGDERAAAYVLRFES